MRAQVSKTIYRLVYRISRTAWVFQFERLVLISNVERNHSKSWNRKQTEGGDQGRRMILSESLESLVMFQLFKEIYQKF